jgi:hypothetical protein
MAVLCVMAVLVCCGACVYDGVGVFMMVLVCLWRRWCVVVLVCYGVLCVMAALVCCVLWQRWVLWWRCCEMVVLVCCGASALWQCCVLWWRCCVMAVLYLHK